jgi:hypothetical protein
VADARDARAGADAVPGQPRFDGAEKRADAATGVQKDAVQMPGAAREPREQKALRVQAGQASSRHGGRKVLRSAPPELAGVIEKEKPRQGLPVLRHRQGLEMREGTGSGPPAEYLEGDAQQQARVQAAEEVPGRQWKAQKPSAVGDAARGIHREELGPQQRPYLAGYLGVLRVNAVRARIEEEVALAERAAVAAGLRAGLVDPRGQAPLARVVRRRQPGRPPAQDVENGLMIRTLGAHAKARPKGLMPAVHRTGPYQNTSTLDPRRFT